MTAVAIPSKPAMPEVSALAQALSALKLDRAADALPTSADQLQLNGQPQGVTPRAGPTI
jgi:hypothetical protein